jgi:hypothetical protein
MKPGFTGFSAATSLLAERPSIKKIILALGNGHRVGSQWASDPVNGPWP